jgi:hypothetical protein
MTGAPAPLGATITPPHTFVVKRLLTELARSAMDGFVTRTPLSAAACSVRLCGPAPIWLGPMLLLRFREQALQTLPPAWALPLNPNPRKPV